MSITDKVLALPDDTVSQDSYCQYLRDALDAYHELVAAGKLRPRENQVQYLYGSVPVKSNFGKV